jgi:hypothetical protein
MPLMRSRQFTPGSLLRMAGLLFATSLMGSAAGAAGAEATSKIFAAQVPGGAVRVLVVLSSGEWPAGGLRVEDGSGTVLAAHVERDAAAFAALDAGSRNALGAQQNLAGAGDAHAREMSTILALRLLSDWNLARALGAGVELPAALHPAAVRVVLLQASGAAGATLGPVPVQKDTGPPAPSALHAEARAAGVELQWQTASRSITVPSYAYSVARGSGGAKEALTPRPELLTLRNSGAPSPYLDRTPPVETTLTYEVRLIDVLGLASEAATVQVQSPDFEAGRPPAGQTAKAGRGLITLSWAAPANARTSGLVVERSQLADGPYERLTPDGLAPTSVRFEDHQVLAGASYYYRVRAVTPSGEMGQAGDPIRAQALSAAALSAPAGLVAEAGISQIALHWSPVPGVSLAGYIIERRGDTSTTRWARLNSRLLPEPHYLDVVGPSQGGGFDYRVTAVAADEGQSPPSAVLHVVLVDSGTPSAPHVLSVSGEGGHVQIHFAAAEPIARTVQVALLRSESPQEDGLVVGAPVAAGAGVIGDDWVRGGEVNWYRLVAFDKSGHRSATTDAYPIRVGAVTLPIPKAPSLSYAADPAPRMTLKFDAPPPHVRVLVEVESEDGHWKKVVGPLDGASALDLNPPGAHANYRIVYVGESGGTGVPSAAAAAH